MEPPSTIQVVIENTTRSRVGVRALRQTVQTALSNYRHDGVVDILLTDDQEMARLNLQYRQIDGSTDVLTFPGPDFVGAPLGEIAISVPWAKRQAQQHQLKLAEEISYLAIHGVLHLVGFDDDDDADRLEMQLEMNKVGMKLGLPEFSDWSSTGHGENA